MLTNLVQKSSKSRWKSLQLFYPRWKHTFGSVDSETASFPGLVLSSASAVRSKSCLNKSAIENHKDRGSTTQCQFIQQNSPLVRFSLFHLFLVRLVTTIIFLCLFWHAQLLSAKHQRCSLSAFHHLCSRVIESLSHRSGFTRAGTPRYWRKKCRKQGLPLGSPGCPGLASWITQPKMGLEQVERKKTIRVTWMNPIL